MKIEVQEGNLGVFLYTVALTESEMNEIEEKAYDYWRKEANIPGYRKGMAPKNLIYQKYIEEIRKTFREILIEKIRSEVSKKHLTEIDSLAIIDQQVKKNESLIEVPGQTKQNEYIFTVKVSSVSEVIIENPEELKELLKTISVSNYSIIEDTINVEEFKKFFFSNKKAEESIKEENLEKYIINIFIKANENTPTIDMHLYLKDFPQLASSIKDKKLLEEAEIKLEPNLKKIVQNYLQDLGVNSEIKDKVKITISEIIFVEDDPEIIRKNEEVFINSYGGNIDFKKFFYITLSSILDKNNVNKLMGRVISKIVEKYKVYVGEKDYISTLISSIYNLLLEYSQTPLHVSMYNLNLTMYSPITFRNILEKAVINSLYRIFLNRSPREDESIAELYEKIKSYCSVDEKNITYKDLRENMPYLLFDFISHNF